MKIWLISPTVPTSEVYDYWDSAVVAAETEELARATFPDPGPDTKIWGRRYNGWVPSPDLVTAELLGEAIPDTEPGVILASFNAG